MLESLRLSLLIGALGTVFLSTVFYRVAGRPFIDWYMRVFRLPDPIQRLLADDRVVRVWALGSSGLSVAVWWYLGTPDGESAFRGLVPLGLR